MTRNLDSFYFPEPFADVGWCGRCAACAAVRRCPTVGCGCPTGFGRARGHGDTSAFVVEPTSPCSGSAPATPACLHGLGRRLAHGLYNTAPLQSMPVLRVRHVLRVAVAVADRQGVARRQQREAHLDTDLTYHQGLALVVSHLRHQVIQGDYTPQTIDKMAALMGSLATYMTAGLGQPFVAGTTPGDVARWIKSRTAGRKSGAASVPLRHLRRSAARLFYRVLRKLALYTGDPTLDVTLPARTGQPFRPLEDDELIDARFASQSRLGDTRLPAAMALGEACIGTGELSAVLVEDCHLDDARVWIRGTRRSRARWGYLSSWGVARLQERIEHLSNSGVHGNVPVIYQGASGGQSGQASSCIALNDILELAGLAGEPGVKPMSIPASFARRVFTVTHGDLGAAADALGVHDLNRAARLIGYDWQQEPEARRHQLERAVLEGNRPGTATTVGVRKDHRRNPAGRGPAARQGKASGTAQPKRPRTVPAVNITRTGALPQ